MDKGRRFQNEYVRRTDLDDALQAADEHTAKGWRIVQVLFHGQKNTWVVILEREETGG